MLLLGRILGYILYIVTYQLVVINDLSDTYDRDILWIFLVHYLYLILFVFVYTAGETIWWA